MWTFLRLSGYSLLWAKAALMATNSVIIEPTTVSILMSNSLSASLSLVLNTATATAPAVPESGSTDPSVKYCWLSGSANSGLILLVSMV